MSPDDILFSPIPIWRQTCLDIIRWIENNRAPSRAGLLLTRPRPIGALLLLEFAEAYFEHSQKTFWRIEYPSISLDEFEFDGILKPTASPQLSFPVYGEVGYAYYRSIEDANLVPNTYTHTFIFGKKSEAIDGLSFLTFHYP